MGAHLELFATAAKGTEGALRDELRELRLRGVRADRGGVHFTGDLADGARACLWSRVAVRVLAKVGAFEARDAAALYDGVRAIDWLPYLTARHTLAVAATSRDSALTHTAFVGQKTKDAVVDQLRDALGARPSVDPDDPDLWINVRLRRDQAEVYVDLAGDALHKRGYRTDTSTAPLKETLAAAILRLAGWDRRSPLVDPMCGTGTFAIEAALWARDIAPGLARARFGFERWASYAHDEALRGAVAKLREDARAAARTEAPEIRASDVAESAVAATRANAKAARVALVVERKGVRDLEGTSPPGVIVANPPYGERLEGGPGLYDEMAEAFGRMHGHRVAVLAGTPDIPRALRARGGAGRGAWEHTLFNGPIECRLVVYDVEARARGAGRGHDRRRR